MVVFASLQEGCWRTVEQAKLLELTESSQYLGDRFS